MDNKGEERNRPGRSKRRKIVNKRNDKGLATDLTKSAKNEEPCKSKADSDGEKSSLNSAIFSNYLLLRGIFKHLDFYSLKSCRQVNHLWNLEATPIFLRNFTMDSITLNEDHLSLSRNWRKTTGHLTSTESYRAFQQLLSHSTEFPSKNFRMDGRKTSDSMYDFLRINGSIVKSFTFVAHDTFASDSNPNYEHDYDPGSETEESVPSSNEILLILSSHLPNLEILKLKQKVCTKMITTSTSDSHKLKKLHTIHLECEISKEFLSGLLGMTMGSLKNIYLYYNLKRSATYFAGLRVLIDLNLIPLLRNISLHIVPEIVPLIERILNQNPTFEKMYLMPITGRNFMNMRPTIDWPKFFEAVNKLVQNSSTSVTHISNTVCSGRLTSIQTPFPKTHSFKVAREINSPRFTPMISSDSLSIPEIFPNLKTFEFVYPYSMDHVFGSRIFMSWTPLLSVRNLKITNVGDFAIKPMWIYIFLDLFPNITSATFDCLNVEASSLIFNFRQLKTLEIMIKAGKGNANFPAMDSMITGFSHETVSRLFRKARESLNLEESCIRAMRVNPSIVDLEDLEELYIDVRDEDDSRNIRGTTKLASVIAFAPGVSGAVLKVRDKVILSHVSRRFGFIMCPQLKSNITINYDSMKSFRMKK